MVLYVVNLWDEAVRDIQVTLRDSGAEEIQVTAHTPDGRVRSRRLRAARGEDGVLTFTIPQVEIYTTVEIVGGGAR